MTRGRRKGKKVREAGPRRNRQIHAELQSNNNRCGRPSVIMHCSFMILPVVAASVPCPVQMGWSLARHTVSSEWPSYTPSKHYGNPENLRMRSQSNSAKRKSTLYVFSFVLGDVFSKGPCLFWSIGRALIRGVSHGGRCLPLPGGKIAINRCKERLNFDILQTFLTLSLAGRIPTIFGRPKRDIWHLARAMKHAIN